MPWPDMPQVPQHLKGGEMSDGTMEMALRDQQHPPSHGGLYDVSVFEEELQSILHASAATPDDFKLAVACVRELRVVVSLIDARWSIQPFGSISNGFAKRGSDLDVTCCWQGETTQVELPDAWQLLEGMLHVLQGNTSFLVLKEIRAARIPILKLKFKDKLDVDVSFKNTEPLRNTQLLRAYARLDPGGTSVHDLGMLVKLWAQAEEVCGGATGNLSSYSFVLMAVFFLQVEPIVNMPCLPTHHFHGGDQIPPDAIRGNWRCSLPASWLLQRFFSFYAWEFGWGTEVVSVRYGRRGGAHHQNFSQLRGRFEGRLHIEDPFLIERNLHCVLQPEREVLLHQKFCEAAQELRSGHQLPRGLRRCSTSRPTGFQQRMAPPPSPAIGIGEGKAKTKPTPAQASQGSSAGETYEAISRSPEGWPDAMITQPAITQPAPEDVPTTTLFQLRPTAP